MLKWPIESAFTFKFKQFSINVVSLAQLSCKPKILLFVPYRSV